MYVQLNTVSLQVHWSFTLYLYVQLNLVSVWYTDIVSDHTVSVCAVKFSGSGITLVFFYDHTVYVCVCICI